MTEIPDGFDKLLGAFAAGVRRRAVLSLLAGNDTHCFTLDQYKVAYEREAWREGRLPYTIPDELAVTHLRSTGLVREVRPRVWAAND